MHDPSTMRTDSNDEPGHVWRISAYAVCRQGSEVLLVRASSRTDVEGSWFLPGGGLEFGEPPGAAVLRELAEETGLTGRDPSLKSVASDLRGRDNGTVVFTIRLIYDVEVLDAESLTFERHGSSDEARWVPLDEVEALGAVPYVLVALGLSSK